MHTASHIPPCNSFGNVLVHHAKYNKRSLTT